MFHLKAVKVGAVPILMVNGQYSFLAVTGKDFRLPGLLSIIIELQIKWTLFCLYCELEPNKAKPYDLPAGFLCDTRFVERTKNLKE